MVGISDFIGPALGFVGGALLGGGGGGTQTETTTVQNTVPQFVLDAQQNLIGQAQQVAGEQNFQFPGPQVAGFNADQLNAFEQVRNLQPGGIGDLNQAGSLFSQAGNATQNFGLPPELAQFLSLQNGQDLQNFQSPFTNQVIQSSISEIDRQGILSRQRLQAAGANAGAFGGARFGIESAELERGLTRERNNSITGLRQAGFENAQRALADERNARLSRFNANLNRFKFGAGREDTARQFQLDAGQGIAGLAGIRDKLQLSPIQALLGIGGQQQGQVQGNLDVALGNFQQQKNFPKEQLQFLSGILSGQTFPTSSTATTQTPTAGLLQQLSGIGIAGLGALGSVEEGTAVDKLLAKLFQQNG